MFSRLMVLIALCISLSPAVTLADDTRWTAWLHYGQHMTLIDSNGVRLHEVDLPLPDNQVLQPEIALSPDGRRAAYITHITYDQTYLTVYDLVDKRITMTHLITGEFWASQQYAGSMMFSDSGTALAFGYGIYHREPLEIEWHVLILNPANGDMIYQIDRDQPAMLDGMGTHTSLTFLAPYIRQYDGQVVIFTLELLETEGNPKSFTWDTATGRVDVNIAYPNMLGNRFVPTGEVVMPIGDARFPGPMWRESNIPLPNSLHVYDPLLHGRYPFYVSADARPLDAMFVQNGERILIEEGDHKWHLLERDGNDLGQWMLPEGGQPYNVRGTPDGFLFVARFVIAGDAAERFIPAVFEVDTRDSILDMGRVVWSTNTRQFQSYFDGSGGAYLNIVWVHSDVPIGPFMPWAQLAEPDYGPVSDPPDMTVSPTPLPPPEPIFEVGDEVKVQTIDGEILNLRAEATRKSEIIVYINDDTHLRLLEGPVAAEGFNWWRIRTPDGLEGWVVENDGELQTLLPL